MEVEHWIMVHMEFKISALGAAQLPRPRFMDSPCGACARLHGFHLQAEVLDACWR